MKYDKKQVLSEIRMNRSIGINKYEYDDFALFEIGCSQPDEV